MTINIGILGFGWVAEHVHFPILKEINLVKEISICDVDTIKLRSFSKRVNKLYTHYNDMLCDNSIDLILVCTPNYQHYNHIHSALKKNKMVFCEKPLCITNDELMKLTKLLANDSQCKLFLGHPNRFREDIVFLKEKLLKKVEKVYSVNSKWLRRNGIPGSSWFLEHSKAGGGVSMDLGSHMLDLVLWLLDNPPIKNYSYSSNKIFSNIVDKSANWYGINKDQISLSDVEDNFRAFITFKNDMSILMDVAWASNLTYDTTEIEIIGSEGIIQLKSLFGFSNNTNLKQSSILFLDNQNNKKEYVFDLSNRIQPYKKMWDFYLTNMDSYRSQPWLEAAFSSLQILINCNMKEKSQ